MKTILISLFLGLILAPLAHSLIAAPVPYSGKVAINGLNFQGDAQFTFALRDANGTVHWRNSDDANASVVLNVDRGLYICLLGGHAMKDFPPNLFIENPQLFLVVNFYREDTGEWLHLQPDQRITSAPHALAAEVARNAFTADAVKPGAISKNMLAADVLADLNATIPPGSVTLSQLSSGVRSDLNGTIPRSRLAPDVLADLNRSIVIARDMLPASVLSDLNRTITKSQLGNDVLADLNASISRSRLAADVLADLNSTIADDSITLDKLSPQVRSDLNGTISRSRLSADILSDLNSSTLAANSVTLDKLSAQVRADLNRTVTVVGTNTGNFEAGLRAYLRPMLKGGVQKSFGNAGFPINLEAPEVDGRFLSYQWYKDGSPISGATGTQYQIAEYNATRDAGDYEIRVSNAFATLKTKAVLETGSSMKVVSGINSFHSLFLKTDGSLWAMGYNSNGQLGDGTTTHRSSPVQVVASGVTQVVAGGHQSFFLKTDGSLWAMGANHYGQLGDGTTTHRSSPVQVVASGVIQIAAGHYHSFFLKTDGSLWAMGRNNYGQLGDGTTTNRSSPVQVVASGVTQVVAGENHSLFLKTNGSLFAMGRNNYGQLGDGTTTQRKSPVYVVDANEVPGSVTQVAAGENHSLFLKSDGSLFAMGRNEYGQLGDGTTTQRKSPVYVVDANEVPGSVTQVAAGDCHSLFLKSDGSLFAMGRNNNGQLGDGTTTQRKSPVYVVDANEVPGSVTQVAGGINHSLFLKTDGSLFAMGRNEYGQLGDGTTTQRNSPEEIADLLSTVEQAYVAETAADVIDP